jgi:hypothetical protein
MESIPGIPFETKEDSQDKREGGDTVDGED